MITSGLTMASSAALSPTCSTMVRLRSSWPTWLPVAPCATRREKCTLTPAGASAIISGSTVGFPGGTKNPSRARHPVMGDSFFVGWVEPRACAAKPIDGFRYRSTHPTSLAGFRGGSIRGRLTPLGGAMNKKPQEQPTVASRSGIKEEWLALHKEDVLEPALEIVDPHHHLWDFARHRYLLHDLLADAGSGHNVPH